MSLVVTQTYCQETYSKVIDLDGDASRNLTKDMILFDGQIVTLSTQFCDYDTSSVECAMFGSFGLNGDLLNSKINDSLATFNGGSNTLAKRSNTLYHSVNHLREGYRNTFLHSYNLNFSPIGTSSYSGPESFSNIGNQGISIIGNNMYVYGDVNNPSGIPDSVQIIKTDLEGNELDRFYFSYGNSSLDINNLQATADGHLAFILKISSPAGANNGFDGYQLIKIDTSGNVLDSFVFEDNGQQPNRILSTSDGSYYFSSLEHPFYGWDPSSYGMINKMDVNMDTLEWSLILPNDQLVDGRHYRMWDYIEASNGDIVACGMAYDNTDTELSTGVPDRNSTWNGFITRITPDGDIKWLRLYKNNNDLLPHDEYGRFRPSRLNKIKELPDGRFVAAGDVFVNNRQISGINEQETEAFHLWLLMVDENGCLEGYNCDEIIRLGSSQNSIVSIGNVRWFYEEVEYFGGGNSTIGFRGGSDVPSFVYEDGTIEFGDTLAPTMYIENDKMYFWDHHFQEYVMYYDWQSTTSYQIKYYDGISDVEEIATVVIDSVTYQKFGDDSLKVQHVHIENSRTEDPYIDVVYEGVGAGYYGIKFLLGCGLCDDNPYTTILRCFSNDSMTYQFVPYSCDSTWLTTHTNEIDAKKVSVYPNPTNNRVYIEGINNDVDYELYTSEGRLVQKGTTADMSIEIEGAGLRILRLKVGSRWTYHKVLKVE